MEDKKAYTTCFHCGENCLDETILFDKKPFCCEGCKTVYEILNQNDLCNYYNLESTPGISPPKELNNKFEYLESNEIIEKLIDFKDEKNILVSFYLPQIHCSSCIWLLENLYKLNPNINSSRVNFLKKEIKLSFDYQQISLRQIVELLSSVGYQPEINLNDISGNKKHKIERSLYFKLGVAGFCFGNIMLISLPEYFGLDSIKESEFSKFFGYINFILSIPVFTYSASDYFHSAWTGLKRKFINIDIPISLGIFVLFFRSSYEIFFHTGSGYFDSLAGLIFFLLLGKIFQQKTYNILSFERDYKSYFPIATTRINKDETEKSVAVAELKVGDVILIKNQELIPVDAELLEGEANIDNSFVTGEALPVKKEIGEKIYAGGKQVGKAIKLKVLKELSHSYLTQLWNDEAFDKQNEDQFENITNSISKYFTIIILVIAFGSGFYWLNSDVKTATNAFTAVLIIACPCALALSAPFTFGNVLRILGRNKFYLKNASVIELLAKINHVIFDKTGTITQTSSSKVHYEGAEITEDQKNDLYAIFRQSSHPLSKIILSFLNAENLNEIEAFEEHLGKGITAKIQENFYQVGSASFLELENIKLSVATRVYLKCNHEYLGYFQIENTYRNGLKETLNQLKKRFSLSLISGDNDSERENLLNYFQNEDTFLFSQSPNEKLNYIKSIQKNNEKTLMIGDGLNDSGALKQSDVGISISEDVNTFSPACDAILDASVFNRLPDFIEYCKSSINVIIISFIISFTYNIIGMFFAVQGLLSPVFAAILMPISSITVVVFVTLTTNLIAYKRNL
ncbi:MAG: heavy metal translocating P-type ATPase metal-binding domain-containing protein [Flavobacteriales bacterium]|nr:heavy metal translocating P-type ATPase metal-binding domain-containing protein [Flavobacteriales bacterium]MCB9334891.1 heavy metal translocating P-type ATPase metal-binding domain-containing protein [Flavobacteriales bacterium]